jgi:hypothetical protein
MPIDQSGEMEGKYRELGLPVEFEVVHGAGHGGKPFYDAARTKRVTAFLNAQLRNGPSGTAPGGGAGEAVR